MAEVSNTYSNLIMYNRVFARGTFIHDITNRTIKVGDGLRTYRRLPFDSKGCKCEVDFGYLLTERGATILTESKNPISIE